MKTSVFPTARSLLAGALIIGGTCLSGLSQAQVRTTFANSTQFDLTGFLQAATLSCNNYPSLSGDPMRCGGTLMVNNHQVVIPAETVVILPASALTWAELFAQNPSGDTTRTGMALADVPTPTTTYEFNVIGNRVIDPVGTNGCANTSFGYVAASNSCDRYIAGMVHVSQHDLNSGAGYINFINYANGEIEVGGQLGVAGTGARVIINDPAPAAGTAIPNTGRYTRGSVSPDGRFQVDPDNPTIASASGYPMCIPRVAPNPPANPYVESDPQCPLRNRPLSVGGADPVTGQQHPPAGEFDSFFTMNAPYAANTTGPLDPNLQAPMQVGDYVNYAGSLMNDGRPYISAHTVINNTSIFTAAGTNPAYVTIEVGLIGTGGLTVFGAGEAAIRTRFEGMTTDPSRRIHLYGIDINPNTGLTTDRDWGFIGVDQGPPTGAVKGRWRFRPPCLTFGSVPTKADKECVYGPSNGFLPPTREVRAVIEGLQSQDPQNPAAVASANGIFYGQYHAPIGEYIFPENVPGQPIPENNFNTIEFLSFGGYTSFAGTQGGVLRPWPSNVQPAPRVCVAPTINGAPYSVANGGIIQLSGSVTANATAPITMLWTAGTLPGGTNLNGALTNALTSTPSFNATGLAAGVYNLTFTASNVCGAASAATTITVQAAPPPTINAIQNQTVTAGNQVTIVATSNANPTPTFAWTQTGGPVNPARTQTPSAATATPTSTITFTPNTAGTYTFSVKATNANGTSSATVVTITVTATVPTNVTMTTEYRTGKQRLVLTALTTDVANVTKMVLMPYLTETGSMFDPATLGNVYTNGGGGSFTLTLVGAPAPACNLGGVYGTPCSQTPFTTKSFNAANAVIGTSAPTALQKIRN